MQTLAYISVVILTLGTAYVLYNIFIWTGRLLGKLFIPKYERRTWHP